jgi:hypothetical protein
VYLDPAQLYRKPGLGVSQHPHLRPLLHMAAMPVIGFLSFRSPGESASVEAAFRQGLREQGYVEGQNLHIAFRWAEGITSGCPRWRPISLTSGWQ